MKSYELNYTEPSDLRSYHSQIRKKNLFQKFTRWYEENTY